MTALRSLPAPTDTGTPTSAAPRPAGPTATLVVAAGSALFAVLVLALLAGGNLPARVAPVLAQAGPLVDWALPVVTFAARLAAVGTIGTLLFAAVLVPVAGPSLPDAGRRSVRAASFWALAWAVATLMTGLLTLARLVGSSPTGLTADSVRAFVGLPAGRTVLAVAVLAGILAVLARRCRTAFHARALLALAAAGVVGPVLTTGHAAGEGDHVLAISVLGAHVLGASVWVGGLTALLLHGRAREVLGPAASRFSALALGCFVVVGGTGTVAAWVVLGSSAAGLAAALGTGYGALLVVKTASLLVLGGFGAWHRHRTLTALRADRPGAFRRFTAVEVAVLLATVAVAVALAASPPPASAAPAPTPATSAEAAPDPMAGHDHGDLSVGVLIDDTRFHVPHPVRAGSTVTVFNSSDTSATITADDGSFDVDVPGHALVTFTAPEAPGSYDFGSRPDTAYRDVLVVE